MGAFTTTAVLATLAVAGAVKATTQIMAGQAQAKSAKSMGEWNADVYAQQAGMISEQKKIEEYQYNRAAAKMRGAITAGTAGRGLLLSGSPLALFADSESQLLFDKAVGQYNLDIQKNYALSGEDYYRRTGQEQARLSKFQGYSNAFSTILNTAGYMAGKL